MFCGLRFLGTAGQNVSDIVKYSSMEDHLEILESTLRLRHLAPTAPDTLGLDTLFSLIIYLFVTFFGLIVNLLIGLFWVIHASRSFIHTVERVEIIVGGNCTKCNTKI